MGQIRELGGYCLAQLFVRELGHRDTTDDPALLGASVKNAEILTL